jgi:hypothetical protein
MSGLGPTPGTRVLRFIRTHNEGKDPGELSPITGNPISGESAPSAPKPSPVSTTVTKTRVVKPKKAATSAADVATRRPASTLGVPVNKKRTLG